MQDCVSWTARWIASAICGGPRVTAPAPYFRTSFRLDFPIRSAVLHITALGLYEGEINGRRVGDLVFAPGWTDYCKRVYFQSYDVASLLTSGDNALGAVKTFIGETSRLCTKLYTPWTRCPNIEQYNDGAKI